MKIPKPYIDSDSIRTFSKELDKEDLIWHYDLEDREILILRGNWMFQFDNEIPFRIKEGDVIFIEKKRWHRLLKGNDDLIIKIKKPG